MDEDRWATIKSNLKWAGIVVLLCSLIFIGLLLVPGTKPPTFRPTFK